MKKERIAQILTYAGLLPFLSVVIIATLYPNPHSIGVNYDHIIMTYGVVIASFIAGIHWGIYLLKETLINLFVHSNIVALLAWLALLLPIFYGLIILIFCFIYLLVLDRFLANSAIIPDWYMRMRFTASIVVILALGVYILF